MRQLDAAGTQGLTYFGNSLKIRIPSTSPIIFSELLKAKDGSQETLVGLVGLFLSYFIVDKVGENPFLVISCFVVFTFMHLCYDLKNFFYLFLKIPAKASLCFISNKLLRTKILDHTRTSSGSYLFSNQYRCNFRAVKSVRQEILNLNRLYILARNFIATGEILSVSDTNAAEPVIFRRGFIDNTILKKINLF